MKTVTITLNEYAAMQGFIHEPDAEMGNLKDFPVMIVVPGGGFRFCSSREGIPVAMKYFAEGFSSFVLDYTTVTKKPKAVMEDPMQDAQAALQYIMDHREELHLAKGKTAMIGFSGGGHLAAACATHGPLRPDALLLGYPGIVHSDLRALDCPDIPSSVDELTPPSFIFSTRADMVTPPIHPLTFAIALDNAGVDFELHIYKTGAHGLSLGTSLTSSGYPSNIQPAFAGWFDRSVQWLKEIFGDVLIYGVNDGRSTKFNIDVPVEKLLEDENALRILRKYLPELPGIPEANPSLNRSSLRQLSSFIPGITTALLEQIDQELLKL